MPRGLQLQKIRYKIKVLGEISDFKIIESGVNLINIRRYTKIYRNEFAIRSHTKVVRHSTTFCCNFTVNKRKIYGIYSKFFKISDFKIRDFNKDVKETVRDFKELRTPWPMQGDCNFIIGHLLFYCELLLISFRFVSSFDYSA